MILFAYVIVFVALSLLAFRLFCLRITVPATTYECSRTLFSRHNGEVSERGATCSGLEEALIQHGDNTVADGASGCNHVRMLHFLQEVCCALPVRGMDLRVLSGPRHFFSELLRQVSAAQQRVVMSALYIGDGPLSKQLVAALIGRVTRAYEENQQFDVCILLDYNRMHIQQNLKTVAELLNLQPVANARSAVNVRLFLFQSPCRWNRAVAPFGRAREALGVQHTKIFCVDGRHTILTGANLSDDYFDTRVDRYLVVENNPHVAAWFGSLVDTLCALSYPVRSRRECEMFVHSASSDRNSCEINGKYVPRTGGASTNEQGRRVAVSSGEFALHAGSDLFIAANAAGVDPSSQCSDFCQVAERQLREFARRCRGIAIEAQEMEQRQRLLGENGRRYDTLLFPTVQCARANIYHDSLVVQMLLRMAPPSTHVYFASPYLNMYEPFVDELLASASPYDFITASVSTNGWYGSKGIAKHIPYFYLQLERAFCHLMKEYRCADRVRVHEFSAEGKTYHAKGLWFVESQEVTNTAGATREMHSPVDGSNGVCHEGASAIDASSCQQAWAHVGNPYLVSYGSTNYGSRSVHRDVEAEVFLYTTNDKLRLELRQELISLLRQSTTVRDEQFVGDGEGRFQPLVSLVAQMGKGLL